MTDAKKKKCNRGRTLKWSVRKLKYFSFLVVFFVCVVGGGGGGGGHLKAPYSSK